MRVRLCSVKRTNLHVNIVIIYLILHRTPPRNVVESHSRNPAKKIVAH